MIRFGINGFGRIGRCIVRLWLEDKKLQEKMTLVQINSPSGGQVGAHLLKYDSIHGVAPNQVEWQAPQLILDGKKVLYTTEKSLESMAWDDVDIVLECSGRYKDRETLSVYLSKGVKKVLLSSPGQSMDKTIVYGVNHAALSIEDDIVSAASCTTNCLAPILDVVMQSREIISGFMTTIHAYTTDQNLTDASHKDLRRARAASHSMIPTKTGAASTIGQVLPALDGKLDGMAVRVPTANVSLLDLTLNLNESIDKQALNDVLYKATVESHKGILGHNDAPLVSCDFNKRTESSVVDLTQTMVQDKTVKIMAWYDNEWAFAYRMIDIVMYMNNQKLISKNNEKAFVS
ncbi:MAG: type I glyceraldehyde-3-phosphate dehydrogenase [Pseudomonadota bacterium]|nr:type I glyceraldehyde-3-phosphate dehydrogenase [Pseudomonadota bacterium]